MSKLRQTKKKVLGAAYSSCQGRVWIPLIAPKGPISLGEGIYMNAGCAGHVVVGAPKASAHKKPASGE